MALLIPNVDRLSKDDPKLGEALKKVQDYANQNVTPAQGNRVAPPTGVTPTQPPG